MENRQLLFEIADRQQGFFTSRQAEEAGFYRSHFVRKVESGEWIKEGRGLYRLLDYPVTDRPELILWTLWSRNREGFPQGVWSHDTALDIHDLSDVMPDKMHMTVPFKFRRNSSIPEVLCLYRANLLPDEIQEKGGFRVTTPLRTIIDVIAAGRLHDGLISQAVRQSQSRGLILQSDLEKTRSKDFDTYTNLMRFFDGKDF